MKKHIKTKLKDFLTNDIKAYRGIGNTINKTYGGSDDNIGTFWTNNLTMAKWFAGLIDFDIDSERYEETGNSGKVIQKILRFKNPYIINSEDADYDSFQTYMHEIINIGGVEQYKANLIQQNYDGIILKDNNTNYYNDGVYDIYIEF